MGKAIIISILLIISLEITRAQQGIKFEHTLSWSAVQEKAKFQNKYIFMDCTASWCTPCRTMNQNIFPLKQIGNYLNEKFISIQVQMDSTIQDVDAIKNWYADAHALMKRYKINSFPTYLFFNPEGEIVHRAIGQKDSTSFISIAMDALASKKQYYTQLSQYKKGEIAPSLMLELARSTKIFNEEDLADKIANDYIQRLKGKDKYTKVNIDFISEFTLNSKEKGFYLFYHHARKINKVMDKYGYAETRIMNIILKEEKDISLLFNPTGFTPNWDSIYANIKRKYSSKLANRTTAWIKVLYYQKNKQWKNYTKNLIYFITKYGGDIQPVILNNYAWDIFVYSTDSMELQAALSWSKHAVKEDEIHPNPWRPGNIDTYANLLYKLGRKEEAINWEEKAVKLDPANMEFKKTLNKIKKGEETW